MSDVLLTICENEGHESDKDDEEIHNTTSCPIPTSQLHTPLDPFSSNLDWRFVA